MNSHREGCLCVGCICSNYEIEIESFRAKVAELEEASVTQKAYYESVFQDGAKRIAAEQHKVKVLTDALENLMDMMELPPDKNCSCFISPPCNECVEYSGVREAIEIATEALATVKEGK